MPRQPVPTTVAPTRRTVPKKRILLLAVSIALLLGVPIVADRTAAALAESRLAVRMSCLAGDTGDVNVSLGGFPFLTQMASGTFDDIRVRADEVTFRDLTLNSIDVTAHGVRVPEDDNEGQASADSLAVQTVVPYASLATILAKKPDQDLAGGVADIAGAQFGGDGTGRLTITTALSLRGMQTPATVYAGLTVAGGGLRIAPEEIELARLGIRLPASRLPAGAADPRTIALPALPAGLTYGDITATRDGLSVTVTGHALRGALGANATGATSTDTAKTCGATTR